MAGINHVKGEWWWIPGASFINKVPRTNLKSVLGHFWDVRKSVSSRRPKIVLRLKCAFHQNFLHFYYALVQGHKISCALSRASLLYSCKVGLHSFDLSSTPFVMSKTKISSAYKRF